MTNADLHALLQELVRLPQESEWIEFKENDENPQEIGEYLSALANSAALHRREAAYIVWGVENATHNFVGTKFSPRRARKGNEELENWLLRLLEPRLDVRIHEFEVDGKQFVLFEVPPALTAPVRFSGTEYIRVGSYKKKLSDFPEKEKALWAYFSAMSFEKTVAKKGVAGQEVLDLLDYPSCFRLLKLPMPDGRTPILAQLQKERLIASQGGDRFDVTMLGAVLFAHRLDDFDRLGRKAMRVIQYRGRDRVETVKEQEGGKGYAVGFEGLIGYINDRLPSNEEIRHALRAEVRMYPEIAVRELVANALIHQDFSLTGTGPMVEIFDDRMEITNPGTPLIDTLRFIDEPPQSRNESLAKLMRRMGICEERGSGIDKVVSHVELFQLPAPDFQRTEKHTKAILYAKRTLNDMDKEDRTRACYQHACLRWIANDRMSNASLRKRFDISKENSAVASRIIKESIAARLIKQADVGSKSTRDLRYVPFWA